MKTLLIILLISLAAFILCGYFLIQSVPAVDIKEFGVTFSKIQAQQMGLNWQKAYQVIFDELQISKVRIPVYWPEVEPEEDVFDFSSIDWMLDTAGQYGEAEIILAVGRKLPRWPECHEPLWTDGRDTDYKNQKLLDYIKKTIERYDANSNVAAWQVENEPFLSFGICPDYEKSFVDEEIALVKSLTDKPILITDSGEFGLWFKAYKKADVFGSTLYRTVYNKFLGRITYPLVPSFFRFKQGLVKMLYGKKPAVVMELQAEPWGPRLLYETDIEEQYETMNPDKFAEVVIYIKGTGFDTFYLWGVEWWYWLKETKDMPEMWEMVKNEVSKLKQN